MSSVLRHLPTRAGRLARAALPTLLVGASVVAAVGLIGAAMALILEITQTLAYGDSTPSTLLAHVLAAPAWRVILAPTVGGALCGLSWWWLRTTGAVVSVSTAVGSPASRPARMKLLSSVCEAVTEVVAVGCGHAIGREGAPRIASAACADRVSALYSRLAVHAETAWGAAARCIPPMSHDMRRTLIAAAAGGGLGAMYHAPLGGAAYTLELILLPALTAPPQQGHISPSTPHLKDSPLARWRTLQPQHIALALCVSLGGTWLAGLLSEEHFALATPLPATAIPHFPDLLALCLCALLIPVWSLAATACRRWWSAAAVRSRRIPHAALPLSLAAAGLCTGVVSVLLPLLPGNGKDATGAALVAGVASSAETAALAGTDASASLLTAAPTGGGAEHAAAQTAVDYFSQQPALIIAGLLLAVALIKPVFTGISLGAGAEGGKIAPSLAVGACLGAASALALGSAGVSVSVAICALVGAAAVLAVTNRAPVFASIFVWELTDAPWWMLGVIAACVALTVTLSSHLPRGPQAKK